MRDEGLARRASSAIVSVFPRGRRSSYKIALLALIFLVPVAALAAETKPSSAAPGPLVVEDAPQPLADATSRTEAEQDHLEAIARFAAGTMHERREEYAEALRCYQRALRCDPASATITRAIIPMAVRLKRYPLAVRYALKAAELRDADPVLLRRLGAYLTEDGDWSHALTLYEKSLAAREPGKEAASDILLRMEMGRLYYLTEQNEKAAECFTRVLQAIEHPDEIPLDEGLIKVLLGKEGLTYQMMGECFLTAGRREDAQKAFDKADEAAPDKALHEFNRARVLAQADQPDEALSAIESALAEGLTDQGMAPYEFYAKILEQLGEKDELIERLEKQRAAVKDNPPLGYYLAGQYRAAGRSDDAVALYRELLAAKPTLFGYRELIQTCLENKQYDSVLKAFGEAIEATNVLDVLGAEDQTVSGNPEAMRGLIEAARNLQKNAPEEFGYGCRLAVAVLALEAKQYETAAEFFNLALAAVDSAKPPRSAEILMAWGLGLILGDRPDEAAGVFQRGIDEKVLPESNPVFYFYLAGALAMARRTDEALAAARKSAEISPDAARFQGREAWVLYMAKRYEEAERAYLKLIDRFDSEQLAVDAREVLRDARLTLSNLAVLRNDMAQAEEWLEQVLDEFPDDTSAMNDLGYLWADQNKHLERSERMIRRAVEAEPDNPAYRDSLGWVLFRLGKADEAVVELEKAVDDDKPDGVVLDHLGDVYEKLGRHEDARQSWRKAAETLRKNEEEKKAEDVEKKISSHAN